MIRRNLSMLLRYNQFVMDKNTAGVTHEESLCGPNGGGNCMNWILGHIVATRNATLSLLGAEPIWDKDVADRYQRGSSPMTKDLNALSIDELKEAATRSHDRIRDALESASDDVFARKAKPDGDDTVGDSLIGLHFHEAYHAGQLGLLRSMLGKPDTLT